MFLLNWYRQYLELKTEYKRVCDSCENLKIQLEAANLREQKLIEALTHKEPERERVEVINPQPIKPRNIPWRVKQQQLEAESRQAAVLLKKKLDEMNPEEQRAPSGGLKVTIPMNAPADTSTSTEELEKELDLVAEEREATHGSRPE